jgi:Protein of unknown function (DUF2924)
MTRRTKLPTTGAPPAVAAIPTNHVPGRLAALQSADMAELRTQWRTLFGNEPPAYSRRFMAARLGYRIQELAYGSLRPETLARLEAIAEAIDGKKRSLRSVPAKQRPVPGTRLIRQWGGVDHTVTVLRDGYEWQGRPYQSLSAIARAMTGTRWNGPRFFGLRGQGA